MWYLQDLNSPPPFQFTGYLQCYLQDLGIHPFPFTWYLQDLGRLPFINLHVIYMICVLLPYNIYSIFLYIYMFQCQNLHDIYSIFWEHVKVQKSCKFTFYSILLPFTCYLHVIYIVCKFSTFPVVRCDSTFSKLLPHWNPLLGDISFRECTSDSYYERSSQFDAGVEIHMDLDGWMDLDFFI